MAKRNKRGLSKKGLFGLTRTKDADGKRVWLFRGQTFYTLREIVVKYS